MKITPQQWIEVVKLISTFLIGEGNNFILYHEIAKVGKL
jgi:hypothetical protein